MKISTALDKLTAQSERLGLYKEPRSSIVQNIRNAAINWPQFLGDVECGILDAFSEIEAGDLHWSSPCHFSRNGSRHQQARTFMLFVAEALES
jgi:hypothetical protein